jgi:ketosteroid isomerase-like protein
MARADVEMLKRGYHLVWREGDLERAVLPLGPDFEWIVPGYPEGEVRRGADEVIAFFRDWIDTWDDFEIRYELREAGPDRVLALVEMRGSGKGSGVRTEMKMAQLWTFRAGRAVRMVLYDDQQEALAAAGLST